MATKKEKVLRRVLGDYYQSSDEFLFTCPFCKHHKKKLSINIEKNVWKCWVCDRSGKKTDYLIKRFGNTQDLKDWGVDKNLELEQINDLLYGKSEPAYKAEVELPEGYQPLLIGPKTFLKKKAIKYLHKRGVTDKNIFRLKIGVCKKGEYGNRIIIPSFNNEGEINYFIARSLDSSFLKYKNPKVSKSDIIFNELLLDFEKPIYIVEGVFDSMVMGKNSVPILGSTIKENSRLFQKIVESNTLVYIALDDDAERKERRIINLFLSYGIGVMKIDTSGYEDVGAMPKEEIADRVENAHYIDNSINMLYNII
jgi:DNA primase